jgi:hypothetical protein
MIAMIIIGWTETLRITGRKWPFPVWLSSFPEGVTGERLALGEHPCWAQSEPDLRFYGCPAGKTTRVPRRISR